MSSTWSRFLTRSRASKCRGNRSIARSSTEFLPDLFDELTIAGKSRNRLKQFAFGMKVFVVTGNSWKNKENGLRKKNEPDPKRIRILAS